MSSNLSTRLSSAEVKILCKVLWSWALCDECATEQCCKSSKCPSARLEQLDHFTTYYARQCAVYINVTASIPQRIVNTHTDLWSIIKHVQQNADQTKAQMISKLFAGTRKTQVEGQSSMKLDQAFAIDLAVRIATMINCFSQPRGIHFLEHGLHQIPWQEDISFVVYLETLFSREQGELTKSRSALSDEIRLQISAGRLKKHLGLTFRPTDNLASHLQLDRQNNVLEVFQHTAVLKEHLRITRDTLPDLPIAESLKLGALPRQLVLEILVSIQETLFPVSDAKSRAELHWLVQRYGFDKDAEQIEHAALRTPSEHRVEYRYLRTRLLELYDELQDPKPRGGWEEWLQRWSASRYTMLATLVGIIIAILLGVAGLAVGIFQSWVSYQAWQHPVTST